MGLFDFIKGQFIEVIEWTDPSDNIMVYRFPVRGNEIKMGAQLTVRESQVAVMVSEGQIADIFTPGRYELYTQNMPVLTKLKSWKYGFNSPFKAEIYFINTKQFTDQKWGTSNPIMMRDADFGMLRLRAYGIFSFRVGNPEVFLKELFGTNRVFDTDSILGQLRHSLVSGVSDALAESGIPALDLAMHYDELGELAKQKLQPRFNALGLELVSLYIENISLPPEVEKVLDKKTSMGVLGNMQQYAQYQAAEAIGEAAKNPGGMAGIGAGIGAGAVIGQAMSHALNPNVQPSAGSQDTTAVRCPHCGVIAVSGAKFCAACGKPLAAEKKSCVKCSAEILPGAKFCPQCGAPQTDRVCSKCGAKLAAGAKFCAECGSKAE